MHSKCITFVFIIIIKFTNLNVFRKHFWVIYYRWKLLKFSLFKGGSYSISNRKCRTKYLDTFSNAESIALIFGRCRCFSCKLFVDHIILDTLTISLLVWLFRWYFHLWVFVNYLLFSYKRYLVLPVSLFWSHSFSNMTNSFLDIAYIFVSFWEIHKTNKGTHYKPEKSAIYY